MRPLVVPYADAVGDSFMKQDDNTKPYKELIVPIFFWHIKNKLAGHITRSEPNQTHVGHFGEKDICCTVVDIVICLRSWIPQFTKVYKIIITL